MTLDIEGIEDFLESRSLQENWSPLFKTVFPGVSLTRCGDSDLAGETPFRQRPGFDLYLVDGRDHCWKITQDAGAATGIVVVEKPS